MRQEGCLCLCFQDYVNWVFMGWSTGRSNPAENIGPLNHSGQRALVSPCYFRVFSCYVMYSSETSMFISQLAKLISSHLYFIVYVCPKAMELVSSRNGIWTHVSIIKCRNFPASKQLPPSCHPFLEGRHKIQQSNKVLCWLCDVTFDLMPNPGRSHSKCSVNASSS